MNTIDISAIILSLIGMASGWLNWYLDRRKHRQEVKNLEAQAKAIEAETRQKYMDLAKMYVDEFTKNIVKPLENRVYELTKEVNNLKNELECVKKLACYSASCRTRVSVLGAEKLDA